MVSKTEDSSSSLDRATMNAIIFKYNGKIYNPKNPEKKLKQLGITWNDVEIIEETIGEKEEKEEKENNRLYHFKNKINGQIISTIYDNLDWLEDIINVNEYEKC